MNQISSSDVYALAKNVLRASDEEAILASKSCPEIQALMSKHRVPIESAIFSFLTEEQLARYNKPAIEQPTSSGWRRLLHL